MPTRFVTAGIKLTRSYRIKHLILNETFRISVRKRAHFQACDDTRMRTRDFHRRIKVSRNTVGHTIRIMLSPTLVLVGLVLGSAFLQLQSASALSPYRHRGPARYQQSAIISSSSLIHRLEQYFQVSLQIYN